METHGTARWTIAQWTRHIESGGCQSCRRTDTLAARQAHISQLAERDAIRAMLTKRYGRAITVTDAQIDAVIAGLAGESA
jgi:hypothetical protein